MIYSETPPDSLYSVFIANERFEFLEQANTCEVTVFRASSVRLIPEHQARQYLTASLSELIEHNSLASES